MDNAHSHKNTNNTYNNKMQHYVMLILLLAFVSKIDV